MHDPQPWFAAKRYGLGAGRPITWQGWVLVGGYLAIIALVGWLNHQSDSRVRTIGFALFAAATATFVWLVYKRTAGGWRWRWGKRD